MSLERTQTAFGAFYRRLAARIGKPQAITDTARKLAVLVYRALRAIVILEPTPTMLSSGHVSCVVMSHGHCPGPDERSTEITPGPRDVASV